MIAHIIPIRPVIVIENNTNESMFVYAGESIYNIEPAPDEVEEIIRSKPEIIAPGKKMKFTSSFISLMRKDAAIDIGWRVGGKYGYNSNGGGAEFYSLLNGRSMCRVD